MSTVQTHYDEHLGPIYEWMAGDFAAAVQAMDAWWDSITLDAGDCSVAVDLGCGHGIQSVSLARRGFSVIALDTCRQLLEALQRHAGSLPVTIVHDDLLNFADHLPQEPDVVVCMGDTITHLASRQDVESVVRSSARLLRAGGTFCVSLRDYSGPPPQGTSRFIPVRADDQRIHTCFLEYVGPDTVLVHDLVYERTESGWKFSGSAYEKQRLAPDWLKGVCHAHGLAEVDHRVDRGMHFMAFRKTDSE